MTEAEMMERIHIWGRLLSLDEAEMELVLEEIKKATKGGDMNE